MVEVVYINALLVLATDIVAFAIMLKIFIQNKRKSALYFSLAWLFDFLCILLTGSKNQTLFIIGDFFLTVFAGLMYLGAVRLLEEESVTIGYRLLKEMSAMAPLFFIYVIAVYYYTKNGEWVATGAAALGISGVFVISGGLLLRPLQEIYQRAAKFLYASLILFGLHLVPASLFGLYQWYLPIGFTLSMIFTIMMAASMILLTSMESFKMRTVSAEVPDIKPGIILSSTKEYFELVKKLQNAPVLAFLRDTLSIPENWNVYFVTTVPILREGIRTVNPTDLARMTELIYQYLESVEKSGGRGVVVIDSLEYLSVYNPWDSLLKFLSKLRDFAMMKNGTVVVVVDKGSVGEKRYAQLKKLLE